ncbi:amidohydrolase family protein [Actinophytocola sp.]|uniref:amidohydrolase family protein n=1 Tax=Actinophytocola sp. TaxID=1872138 RepID=UPI002ED42371
MRTLIQGVRVFTGEEALPGADVLIEDGRIGTPDGGRVDETVPGAGRTLLPGLIDAHVHVSDGSLEQALSYGVTTELDMFCLPDNLARQRRLAADRHDVADLRSSGVLATAPGGHPSQIMANVPPELGGEFDTVAGPGDAAAFVAARVAEGVDYLKVVIDHGTTAGADLPVLTPDTVAALTEAAHAAGLRVIAHAASAADTKIALDAGVDGLAHVPFDAAPEEATDLVARCAAENVFVVSTLVYVEWLSSGQANPAQTATPLHLDDAMTITGMLAGAGVRLLAGTDANLWHPQHGVSLHRELELLVQAGLTPTQALAAATSIPAATFDLTDRGRIAPGLRADLLLVEGDPTTDITATAAIAAVWRGGTRLTLPHGRPEVQVGPK